MERPSVALSAVASGWVSGLIACSTGGADSAAGTALAVDEEGADDAAGFTSNSGGRGPKTRWLLSTGAPALM